MRRYSRRPELKSHLAASTAAATFANGILPAEPKSACRVNLAFVKAGDAIPHKNRATCRPTPKASGYRARNSANASIGTA
jgi:hypothetical protein